MSVIWFLISSIGRTQIHDIDLKYITLKTCIIHHKLLREHEGVVKDKVELLCKLLESNRYLKYPILVDARTFTILDGHHRFHALKSLGYEYIPVFFVDYAETYIKVTNWRKEFIVTKVDVLKRALEGSKYPPRTSRHVLTKIYVPCSYINLSKIDEIKDINVSYASEDIVCFE